MQTVRNLLALLPALLLTTDSSYGQIQVPLNFPTIQQAIGAATAGDEIVVAAGDYVENLDFQGKAITVRSASGPINTTLIPGTTGIPIVSFTSSEGPSSVLEGFTLVGGASVTGAALLAGPGHPRIIDCVFTGNVATGSGGAVAVLNASAPSFSGCIFDGNQAGDGVFQFGQPLKDAGGGAVVVQDGSAPLFIDCRFEANQGEYGGAVESRGSNPTFVGCTFRQNSASLTMVGGDGGALSVVGGLVLCSGCLFSDNVADGAGGAVRAWQETGFGVPELEFVNCMWFGNVANESGGAVRLSEAAESRIVNATIAGNAAPVGGAMRLSGDSQVDLYHATIVGNQGSGSVARASGDSQINLRNSIVWDHTSPFLASGSAIVGVQSAIVQGGFVGGSGVLNLNPSFVDEFGSDGLPATGDEDYSLTVASPAIDGGDSTLLPEDFGDLDADGDIIEPLPQDILGALRVHGALPDLGAFEFTGGTAFVRGDSNLDGSFNLLDGVFLLNALFVSGAAPLACEDAGDGNDDGVVNLSDAVTLLSALFVPGAMALPAPHPGCGPDPSTDGLACGSFPGCP